MNDRALETCARIAQLNDAFRKTGRGGRILMTQGIYALGVLAGIEILLLIRNFDDFSGENDPYFERDMGAFSYAGQRMLWKIDYYDSDMRYGSPDPANPDVTTRVLTILLASEY
ncbi:DUF3768 domain-containing protein [Sphingomonas sp. C3-2]|uniref:DUF3768 domain-containing protein n=1 Tax=Sphingomonas sp. C3-2 TaxID=3062169 RepID=UPI00294B8DE9|nr:DUF3768 domain-containing protein [Sphingomonas sp. C3-2]WOK37289.1 DUF3768 domain-containing protein [Sphingomonas sp. C3-2]